MTIAKRPLRRPFTLFLILAAIFLASCAAQPPNENWPGLSQDGDTLYVSHGPGFFAFDAAAQDLLWQYRPENAQLFFYAPPSVVDNRLIIGDYGAAGGMLSPQTITSVYGMEIVDDSRVNPQWMDSELVADRIVGEALQVGDVAYVTSADNSLLALNGDTGELLWEFSAGFSIWAQPVLHDGTLFVTSLDRNLYALDEETGSLQWSVELSGAIAAQPVLNVDAGLLYVTSFDKSLHALQIADGTEIWAAAAEDWIWSAPAFDAENNVLFYADAAGNVFAVDALSGSEVWTTAVHSMNMVEGVIQDPPMAIKGAIQASPLLYEDKLLIASEGNPESGEGLLVALERETGAELWQTTVQQAPLFSTPVIAGEAVVVGVSGDTAVLIAFDPEDGNQLWAYAPPAE